MYVTNIASAGFVVEISGIKLIMDPWLVGTGFIGGWAPLSFSSFSDIPTSMDFLWVSHEHPDHFSPPTLKKLFQHFKKLPLILFQETVDDRVLNWFEAQGCTVKVLRNKSVTRLGQLEFRLQKFGLYDSILQIRNKTECFTSLNDAPIQSGADLKEVKAFAGERHHVLTSQYGVANSENAVDDAVGWAETVASKKQFFAMQVNAVQPDLCIPAASSVHFCAEDNIYMNKYRVNPSIFTKNDYGFSPETKVLLPLPSKKIDTKNEKDFGLINKQFEMYYDDLLDKTKNLVIEKKQPFNEIQLKEALTSCSKNIFKNNNRFIIWLARPLGLLKDQVFYLTDLNIYIRSSLWRGNFVEIPPCKNSVSINSEVLAKTYSSPYGADALIASGRYDLKTANLKSLLDHLSIIHINTAGIYFNFSIIFDPREIKALVRATLAYLTFFRARI